MPAHTSYKIHVVTFKELEENNDMFFVELIPYTNSCIPAKAYLKSTQSMYMYLTSCEVFGDWSSACSSHILFCLG